MLPHGGKPYLNVRLTATVKVDVSMGGDGAFFLPNLRFVELQRDVGHLPKPPILPAFSIEVSGGVRLHSQ